ncbi:MAG: LLM class flavin-dependent oxidoreductase [Burkholderiaceae bacterium]|jgi:luciferase family oxidoreductase group 1|nr:LLM class flavin-dependent oxidoreductase [Burkholderiaceae bacterium]
MIRKPLHEIDFSMLDLVPVREGHTVAEALGNMLSTARHVEQLGFTRYWLAEHHNMPGIASSATSVLVGQVAGGTRTIRVGSGGVMLPNRAPLTVAEDFGTLAELFPGRIDLGLGRAPGTDPVTANALRRDHMESVEDFPRDVEQLQRLLDMPKPGQQLVATPGAGTRVPIWLLGSSLFSAQLAAQRGLPYAFASHFAPAYLMRAIEVYRRGFRPSAQCEKPRVMIGVPLIAAPTDAEAQYLASSIFQRVLSILRGRRGQLPPPREGFLGSLTPGERAGIAEFLACAVIGSPATVRQGLQTLADETGCDEMIFTCDIYEPQWRLRALAIAADVKAG